MRKSKKVKESTKKEKFVAKVENYLDDFYSSFLTSEQLKKITERFEKHSQERGKKTKQNEREARRMVDTIKEGIDKFYIANKVESKYIYFSNLYEIYDMICEYFFKDSKFIEFGKICDNVMDTVVVTDTNLFGYQTAFNKEINKMVDDSAGRFYKTIVESFARYGAKVRPERKRELEKKINNIVNLETLISIDEKVLEKEVAYINGILNRVKYARDNINLVAMDIVPDDQDKRIRKNIKWLCTRTENILKTITKEL